MEINKQQIAQYRCATCTDRRKPALPHRAKNGKHVQSEIDLRRGRTCFISQTKHGGSDIAKSPKFARINSSGSIGGHESAGHQDAHCGGGRRGPLRIRRLLLQEDQLVLQGPGRGRAANGIRPLASECGLILDGYFRTFCLLMLVRFVGLFLAPTFSWFVFYMSSGFFHVGWFSVCRNRDIFTLDL